MEKKAIKLKYGCFGCVIAVHGQSTNTHFPSIVAVLDVEVQLLGYLRK